MCPIARALDVIGDWWSLLIVRDIFLGKRRFTEIQKSLGLAKNILCARLQKLVAHGVLETAPAADRSAYQEYRLTDKGRGLYLVLVALRQWGESNLFKKGERKSGKPLQSFELRSKDGRLLGLADFGLK
jgi:DNA-binding HxlR family transcriptional regulator